jgi:hypothetical protein
MRRFKIIKYNERLSKVDEIKSNYQIVRISLDSTKCIVRVNEKSIEKIDEKIYSEEEIRNYLVKNIKEWENEMI